MKCFALAAIVASTSALDAASQFASFKTTYGKTYATAAEETTRFANFQATLASIAKLNAMGGAEFAINKFSDLSPAEFKARYLRYTPTAAARVAPVADFHTEASLNATATDWRDTPGAVSAVKDQGQCGSCWAYSATEQIESNYALAGNSPLVLSPQQIISCDKTDDGCNGGNTETAYDYVKKAGGISLEKKYPDTSARSGKTGMCHKAKVESDVKIKGYTYATPECSKGKCNNQDEDKMSSNIAAHAPASICVNAEKWQSYKRGVLTGKQCGGHTANDLDHCVQAIGFDTSGSEKYWIVRNSWNTDWGIKGIINVEYGTNACGIANDATFVTIAASTPTIHVEPTVSMDIAATTHYGDPLAGACMADEQNITIQGIAGSVCSPAATGAAKSTCPTDTPAGCKITPAAILQDTSGDKYCALECSPSLPIKDQKLADTICGVDNMSCKPISGVGICTYDA